MTEDEWEPEEGHLTAINRDLAIIAEQVAAMERIEQIQTAIEFQRDKAQDITQKYDRVGGGKSGGVPHGLEGLVAELDELRRREVAAIERYTAAALAAEEVIEGINNPQMKRFVTWYYVRGVKIRVIAAVMHVSERHLYNLRERLERARTINECEFSLRRISN